MLKHYLTKAKAIPVFLGILLLLLCGISNRSYAQTYCTPTAGSSSTTYYISSITTTNGTTNIAYTASSFTGYVNNSATTFSQYPSASVNVSMNVAGSNTFYYYCWIDWNNDGVFNTSNEQIFATTTYASPPYANVINVPAGQATGNYRVRFATSELGAVTSCGPANYGNYVDYTLNVLALSPCSGQPNAGTASLSPSSGSPSSSFTASATGITNAGSIGFQWQQSANGTTGWANVAGATAVSSSITASASFGVTIYYRLRTICTNTNDTNYSNVVPFTTSYCTPTGGASSTSYYVNNITTTGGIANIAYTASSYTAYVNNSAFSFAQVPGSSINISLSASGGSTYYYYCWVDWNNDGVFTGTGETIFATTSYTSSPYNTGVINVSSAQAPGNYRVRFAISFIGAITSCGPAAYGNYVDYTLNVITLTPCSGQPNAGTASLSSSSGSPSSIFTAAASGVTFGTGIAYQWQQSANGTSGWSNVAGATTANSSITATATFGVTTYYKLRTICSNTNDTNYSNIVSFTTSYCTPAGGTSSSTYYISSITTTNGMTNIAYTASSFTGYVNNSATTFSQLPGGSINVSMNVAGVNTFFYYCWIDWNNDGVFNTSNEQIFATTTYAAPPYAGVINILSGQIPGNYRVRFATSELGAITACGPATYGNYVDYTLTVVSPCSSPTNLAVSNLTDVTATLSWTAVAGSVGYEYVLDQNAANPTSGTSTTLTTYNASGLTPNTTYYMHVRNSCGSVGFSSWVTLMFKTCAVAAITPLSSTTFCTGSSVTLNGPTPPSGTTYTYQWQLNGGNITTGGTGASYTATGSGNYTLILTNTTGNCTSATTPATIVTVGVPPSSAINPANTAGLCPGGSTNLATNQAPGLVYQWYQGGNPINGATNSTYSVTTTGSYSVNVSSGPGCNSTTASPTVVSILTPPPAAITPLAHPVICQSGTTILTANSGTNYTYQWYFNGNPITTNGVSITYNAANAGSYAVKVTNTSINCGATSQSIALTIAPLPPAIVSPATASSGCDSLVLTANSGAGYTYKWKLNNSIITGAASQTYPAATSGSYASVVTDTNGCSGTSTNVPITINPSPASIITYSSPLAFCDGGAVALNSYISTGLSYQWLKNGSPISADSMNTLIAFQAGSYSLRVTNSFGCSRVSEPIQVQVYALPAPTITRDANNVLSTGIFEYYQWYINNQPIPGATAQTYAAIQNGAYAVDVTDLNGCRGKSEVNFVNNTGVKKIAGQSIHIYPNPTRDIIYIESSVMVNVTVRDMAGRNIIVAPGAKQIDMSKVADGIYMLMITDSEGHFIKNEKLVKVK